MDNFERWKAAYIAMDDRRRGECLSIAEGAAADHPARKTTSLLLVSNSNRLYDTGDSLRGSENRLPPVVVRAVE